MADQILKEMLEVDITDDFRDFFIQNFEVSVFLLTILFFVFYFQPTFFD